MGYTGRAVPSPPMTDNVEVMQNDSYPGKTAKSKQKILISFVVTIGLTD